MGVLISGLFMVSAIAAVASALHFALRRLTPMRQLLVSGFIFLATWLFTFNTNLVLLRAGYCVGMPLWPPFLGHTVDIPRWIMPTMSLLAIASVPLLVVSILRLWRTRRPKQAA